MLPPLPRCSRWAYSSLKLAHPCQPSPIPLSGRPAHRHFRGLLGVYSRCGLHTRAVTKFVTAIRGLQTFRHLHACPGCFRLERIAGWALHPLEKRRLVTAHVDSCPSLERGRRARLRRRRSLTGDYLAGQGSAPIARCRPRHRSAAYRRVSGEPNIPLVGRLID
jgi:hypothetical protein